MDGILLVDKPKDWTSHDVVAKVRSILHKAQREGLLGVSHLSAAQGSDEKRPSRTKQYNERVSQEADAAMRQEPAGVPSPAYRTGRSAGQQGQAVRKIRVGHSGTLDPMATGLLVLLIGKATKQQAKFMKLDKTYEAEITLGATSDTDDAEGDITGYRVQGLGFRKPSQKDIKQVFEEFIGEIEPFDSQLFAQDKPSRQQVEAVLNSFVGEGLQLPPTYSALKVGGKRAYKEARAGKKVELEPRKVTIQSIDLQSYKYPKIRIKTDVSSGTYIRALARDIGGRLGTGAYLSRLRRTHIGDYTIKNSTQIKNLDAGAIRKSMIHVQSRLV